MLEGYQFNWDVFDASTDLLFHASKRMEKKKLDWGREREEDGTRTYIELYI